MSVSPPTLAPNPWLRILDALEKKVNRHSYDTWLKPTRYSHASGGILFVRVPNPDFQQLGDKYGDLIQEALDQPQLSRNTRFALFLGVVYMIYAWVFQIAVADPSVALKNAQYVNIEMQCLAQNPGNPGAASTCTETGFLSRRNAMI